MGVRLSRPYLLQNVAQERSLNNELSGLGDGGVVQVRMTTQTTGPLPSGPQSTQVCEMCGDRKGTGTTSAVETPCCVQ